MSPTFLRPEPILDPVAVPAPADPDQALALLRAGRTLRVTEHYGAGIAVLDALDAHLPPPPQTAPLPDKRAWRRSMLAVARRLLVEVVDHRVALPGAAPCGFLADLYPELSRFWLPLVDVRDLQRAWRRYDEGVLLPVLGYALHPFFGTYVPTRQAHLELFATWLHGYAGPRRLAVDVGTGCGVLALMLARAGFGQVVATDTNGNAIESVRRELRRRAAAVDPRCTDLLGPGVSDVDLVVFNPPWTHGPVQTPLDAAMRFDDTLFPRFFDEAAARLAPEGRVVLLFSNLLGLVQPDVPHPIEAELARGRFTLAGKLRRRVKPPEPERGGGRPRQHARRTRERVEVWELALRG